MQDFRQEPTEEEAEAILKLAAQRVGIVRQGVRERMRATAAELGISEADLAEAEAHYRNTHQQSQLLEEYRDFRLHGWRTHLVSFVSVNFGLFIINMLTSPHHLWFVYPLAGWGIGMAIHTGVALSKHVEPTSDEFRAWLRLRSRTKKLIHQGDSDTEA